MRMRVKGRRRSNRECESVRMSGKKSVRMRGNKNVIMRGNERK